MASSTGRFQMYFFVPCLLRDSENEEYPKSNFGSSHWSHAIVLIQYNRQRTTRVLALLATCLSGSLTDYQTDPLVNNCYKSCWRWSVSQFSTYMRLLRHGCQRHIFWNSQTDSQMYTFPNQMNSQVVQIFMESKFQSKLCLLDKDDVKQKTTLFSVQGKSSWFLFFCFPSSVSATQFK